MSDNQYDEIAAILREAQKRYGENAFENTRRLKGLLADHLFDKINEINIVISAIEDGVPAELKRSDPQERDITISRLTERLEANRGVRGEIARSAVMAIAFGMNMSDLPSSQVRSVSQRSTPMPDPAVKSAPVPKEAASEWVGLSEVASTPAGRTDPPETEQKKGSVKGGMKAPPKTWLMAGGAAVVAVVAYMGTQTEDPPAPQRPPAGQEQPQQPQPQQPQPQPQQPQPQQPQPQQPQPQQPAQRPPVQQPQQPAQRPPVQQPQAGQPVQSFYLADDYGLVWQASTTESSDETGTYVLYAQTPNGTVQMVSQLQQDGSFYLTLTLNGNMVARGQAWLNDQTHYNYQLQDANGSITTGLLHLNHMPD